MAIERKSSTGSKARRLAGVVGGSVAIFASSMLLGSNPANAAITWDAPPTCFRDGTNAYDSSNGDGGTVKGLYSFAYEYSRDIPHETVIERQYVWVYEVQVPHGGVADVLPGGLAEKVCGADYLLTTPY